jgi:hypothetical protein
MRAPLRFALPVLSILCGAPAMASPIAVDVVDTRFRVTMADGQVSHSDRLAGAVLTIGLAGRIARVRIDAVEPDTRPGAGDVWLHSMSIEGADGQWRNLCQPDPEGRRLAFPIAGSFDADGMLRPAEAGRFELACTGGARAKCVRFGYKPWAMLDAYNACVRMVRADYGGRGAGTTRNGMLIDMYDRLGINTTDYAESLAFEAGWGPQGAVCVHHPRVAGNVTLEQLEARYPHLKGRTGAICTEAFARAQGALIFNRSVVTERWHP